MAEYAVELRGVAKRFGSVAALDGVDLAIRKGEFFSLLGPSGCGKTTTLNLIGGFETASAGTLLIDGQPMGDTPSHARPVNTVFQSYALFPHMSVEDNVGFGLRMKKVPRPERNRAVEDVLRLVSLEGFEARRPSQLSGGQRQRVALARALVNHPAVLLLDEPLGALDLKLRKQMQAELTRLQRRVGITFVYVTHDQDEAMSMSDRIAVMDRGRVLQVGTPAEIYGDPADRFVMEFIGTPNVLAGRLERAEAGVALVAIDGVGRAIGRHADTLAPGAGVAMLVRPERVRIGGARADGPPPLPGHVTKVADLGFVSHVFVRLAGGQELLAYRLNDGTSVPAERVDEGQAVAVWWNEEDARVYAAGPETLTAGAPSSARGAARS